MNRRPVYNNLSMAHFSPLLAHRFYPNIKFLCQQESLGLVLVVTSEVSAPNMPVMPQQLSSPVWRIINFLMAFFFSLAAVANANDDDWYLWVPVYTVPALLSVSASIKPSLTDNSSWQMLITFVFTLCILYGLYQMSALLSALSGGMENPLTHEEGREMGGLLIILAWAGITRFSPIGRSEDKTSNRNLMRALIWISVTLAILPLFTWSLCFFGDWHKHLGHCNSMFKS